MSKVIANISGVTVEQDPDKRIFWTSKAAIDADGANGQNGKPFAYGKNDSGLDLNKNAGWPNKGWRDVLIDDGSGHPLDDGNDNWYSQTAYSWPGRPIATRFVDATTVPYVVVNPFVRKNSVGVVLGCLAKVTFNGTTINAVVADVSGGDDIGELSIAAGVLLGFQDTSPRTGGAKKVQFELFPDVAAVIGGVTYRLIHG